MKGESTFFSFALISASVFSKFPFASISPTSYALRAVKGFIISFISLYTVKEVTMLASDSFNVWFSVFDRSDGPLGFDPNPLPVFSSAKFEDIEGMISDMNDIPVLV